ncbi:MAG TPA: YdeI/OmpD-associated family protein [Cyclobacteriaceae bacterium]|nr:YdeI/OmpD-associated family protein [Cyclobacteriaceae bacterium]
MEAIFFASPGEFRKWLERNHKKESELWVGYYKKYTGKPSLTWSESVDEALCYGWIDGIRKSVDPERYMIRFTPRKPGSAWSKINIRKVGELSRLGRMQPAGIEAFGKRDEKKLRAYSFETLSRFSPGFERLFRKNKKAWSFFESKAPYYRKIGILWVMSAKREETRMKRLNILINESAEGRIIGPMKSSAGSRNRN